MKKLLLIIFVLALALAAFAQTDITIGTGTSTGRYPLNDYYVYSRSQCIYLESEIGAPGTIHKLRWYRNDTGADPLAIGTTQIWLKTVSNAVMTDINWEDPGTMVAEITDIDLGAGDAWYEIDITDFAYSGGNLLVSAYTQNAAYTTPHAYWRYTATTGFNRCRLGNSDGTNPPTLSLSTSRPNIQINMTAGAPSAAPNAPILAAPGNGTWAFLDTVLSWNSGGGFPATYDVYFDTVDGSTLVSDDQAGLTYTPSLAPGTTYYWKVVAANSFGDSPASAVWSFQTPTATQLAESFEVAVPPLGWANGTSGSWSRNTSYYKHGVASAYKYGSTTTAYVLSTPKVTITPTSTLDIWTLASSATGTLQVVYSPDRVTWTALGTPIAHAATYTWYNTVADLSSLAGNNYYLGIQTGLQSASFYVDLAVGPEITPEAPGAPALTAPADLAINVNEYPTFTWTAPTTGGVPTGYNIYLDTVDGTTLYASNVTSPYTPASALAFDTTYYWTVEAYNGAGTGPQAAVRSFTTRSDPTVSSFPYEVDFSTFIPLNWAQYNYLYGGTPASGGSWGQDDWLNILSPVNKAAKINIYYTHNSWLVTPPIQIPATGYELKFDLALMAWNSQSTAVNAGEQADDRFLVVISDNPDMTNPTTIMEWNNTGSDNVYDDIPPAGGTYTIDLDGYVGTKYFGFYAESTVDTDGDNDLMIDNVIIRETPAAPIFSYDPTSIDFGQVQNGVQAAPQNVTITNDGGGTLNIAAADVSLSGTNAAEFSFGTGNLPAALAGGQSVVIPVYVTGVTEGAISATLTIVNAETRTNYDVALAATVLPAGIVVIGNGTANNYLPVNPFYGYTYSQSIFLQSELNTADQRIEKVWYNWNGVAEAVASNDWTIYMGHTAATEFASTTDWVPLANLSTVFTGTVALPATAGWIEITLDSPFIYNNTDNLVIAVDENAPSYDGSSEFFYSTAAATNRSLRYYSDGTNPNPAAPVAGTLVPAYPNVMLQFGDIPIGAPGAPVLTYPADSATDLPIGGFDLTWTADPNGGLPERYMVYLAGDTTDILESEFQWETTNTHFNPITEGGFEYAYEDVWYWTVKAINLSGEAAAVPFSFTIQADPAIVNYPWNEDFEDGIFPPSGWTVADMDGAGTNWAASTSYNHTSGGTTAAKHGYSNATPDPGQNGWLITPPATIPVSTYDVVLSWWNYNVFPTWMVYNGVKVNTTNDPADPNWVELWSQDAPGSAWSNEVVNINAYQGQTVYFAFNYQGYDADDWYVDDVSISELIVDLIPPTITHLPVINTPREDLEQIVVADIRDDATWNNPIGGANLYYSIDGGTTYSAAINMIAYDDTTYYAFIPAQPLGTTVTYYLEAWDSLNNMTTTNNFAYGVNDPTWIWYDLGGTTYLGYTTTDFGPTVMFENPFYGTGNAMQLLTTDGSSYYGNAANLQIWTYDGVNDLVPYFATPIPVTFGAQTYETFDLSTYNVQITDPYFFISYLDVPMGNYILFDGTYDYGTTYVFQGTTLYTLSNPGSWAIGANVTTGLSLGLDAPVISIALTAGQPTLNWTAIDGANSYLVYGANDPYAADPWTLLDTVYAPGYTYTGTAAMEFFKVTASDAGAPARANLQAAPVKNDARIEAPELRMNVVPKGSFQIRTRK